MAIFFASFAITFANFAVKSFGKYILASVKYIRTKAFNREDRKEMPRRAQRVRIDS